MTRALRGLAGGALVLACSAGTPALASPLRLTIPAAERLDHGPGRLTPPDLSHTSPRVELALFDSWGSPTRGAATTCVTLPVGGWVDEARPIVLERIAAMASATVARARGTPPRWRREPSGHPRLSGEALLPDPGESANGSTFLGFSAGSAVACWAVCFGPDACEAHGAVLEGAFVAPPPPGLALQALVAGVHRPRAAGTLALALGVTLAMLYVRARPRPKTR